MRRPSAGLLLYRRGPNGPEVLLGHPGGPYWTTKDDGAWGIPKGEFDDGETDAFAVAKREFREETGHDAPADEANAIPLGQIRKRSGKIVTAWAVEGVLDPATAVSHTFPLEWPPRSGQFIDVPEFDRLAWFGLGEAREKMRGAEEPLVERLAEHLAGTSGSTEPNSGH
jgi:predicted NUDIX family NTP pyrophosphohydrolase